MTQANIVRRSASAALLLVLVGVTSPSTMAAEIIGPVILSAAALQAKLGGESF